MTVLMRLDCNQQDIDQAELKTFMGWMRDVVGVDPHREPVRAVAIEALDGDPAGRYRLHVTKYVQQPPGKADIVIDPATCEPQLSHEASDFVGMTWPFVRAAERHGPV